MLAVLREVPGIEIDYVEVADPENLMSLASAKDSMALLVAVRIGSTRLIDNLVIQMTYPSNAENPSGEIGIERRKGG